jgi:hypothetical protein
LPNNRSKGNLVLLDTVESEEENKKHREALGKAFNKAFYGKNLLGQLFDEDELADKLLLARRRVIRSFHFAEEPYREEKLPYGGYRMGRRGTDNYIIGVGQRRMDLVHHIVADNWRPIVTARDLPDHMSEFNRKWREMIADRALTNLYALQVNLMCSKPLFEIYFDEARGIWQIVQSAVDEYLQQNRRARNAVKFDCRPEHGMVRAQRINRGRIAGVSTSQADDRMVV